LEIRVSKPIALKSELRCFLYIRATYSKIKESKLICKLPNEISESNIRVALFSSPEFQRVKIPERTPKSRVNPEDIVIQRMNLALFNKIASRAKLYFLTKVNFD
jgi:predicted ATP-grasp superfamily ATP-dependent carboligase